MKPQPLIPAREQERIQLEMLAFERPGDRLKARLLPAAAGLAILEDLVSANDTGVFHHQVSPPRFGPEHEGRVAVASPGDGDRSFRRAVLDQAMLGEDAGGISL